MTFRPLCGYHSSTFSATKKSGKWKIVMFLRFARFCSFSQSFLYGFKQIGRKNWRKCAVIPLAMMLYKTEICPITKHRGDGTLAKWRSVASNYAVIRQKLRD